MGWRSKVAMGVTGKKHMAHFLEIREAQGIKLNRAPSPCQRMCSLVLSSPGLKLELEAWLTFSVLMLRPGPLLRSP